MVASTASLLYTDGDTFVLENISNKADIYSFGCVIYEMLALNIPHLPPLLDDSDSQFEEESFDEDALLYVAYFIQSKCSHRDFQTCTRLYTCSVKSYI